MYEIDLAYQDDTLYVYLKEKVTEKTIKKLKQDLYKMTDEYGISEAIINVRDVKYIERDPFCEMMDQYEMKYGTKVHLIDTRQAIL